jgi:hypothetical protein
MFVTCRLATDCAAPRWARQINLPLSSTNIVSYLYKIIKKKNYKRNWMGYDRQALPTVLEFIGEVCKLRQRTSAASGSIA